MKHVVVQIELLRLDGFPSDADARAGSRRGDRRTTTWFTASSLRSLLRDVAPRRTREARASAGCDDPSRPPVRPKPTPTRGASARTSRFPLDWRSGRAAPCFRMPCFRTKALGVSSFLSASRPLRALSLIFSRWVRASFRFLARCSLCTPPETPLVSSSPSEVSFSRPSSSRGKTSKPSLADGRHHMRILVHDSSISYPHARARRPHVDGRRRSRESNSVPSLGSPLSPFRPHRRDDDRDVVSVPPVRRPAPPLRRFRRHRLRRPLPIVSERGGDLHRLV